MRIFRLMHDGVPRSGVVDGDHGRLFEPGTDVLRTLTDPAWAQQQLTDDVVALDGERLGTIRNRVVDAVPVHPVPRARRRPWQVPAVPTGAAGS
ncbi:Rv2993c-like domain-containing protein [Tersicoccus sp. MR15.9]|uniref:Rv2993c-like domain-containing protein n=1 Tax=Tersicoccus mangrovi TaxID=3121635 RepID=UPI002FE53967